MVRQGYPQPVYSLSAGLVELIEELPNRDSAPCFHFVFTLLGRLLCDEQMLSTLSTHIVEYLLLCANALIMASQMKINFCITSAVILLRTILMQLSYGMQQHLLQPLNGSQLCEYSEQQDLERFYLQVSSKL